MKNFIVLLIVVFGCFVGHAEEIVSGDFVFELDREAKTAELVSRLDFYYLNYPELTGVLSIPQNVYSEDTEYTVSSIGNSALKGSKIEKLIIPSTINKVGARAFADCESLREVIVEDGTSPLFLAPESFKGVSLEFLSINRNVGSAAVDFFHYGPEWDCKTVEIGSGVTEIGQLLFCGCKSLEAIELPVGLSSIGNGAFWECSFREVKIPETVKSIGATAFADCKQLGKINLPKALSEIEHHTFARCESLVEIEVPASVKKIGSNAFSFCSGIRKIKLNGGISSIGNDAFEGCDSLERVEAQSLKDWRGINFENSYANPLVFGSHLYIKGKEINGLDIPKTK